MLQQLIQGQIFHKVQIRVLIRIVPRHPHAKPLADPGHGRSDAAGSDDAGRLLIKVIAHQAVQAEIIFPHPHVRFVHPAAGHQRQPHGVLRHRLRRIAGNPQHLDAALLSRLHIHVVEAGAAHENAPHAALVQRLYRLRSNVGIDKGADRVVPSGKGRRVRRQVRLQIIDLNIRKIPSLLFEGIFVITFGIVK